MPLFQFAFNSGLLGFTPRNIFNFFRIEILPSHENGRCALFTPDLSFELFRKWLLQFQFDFNWVLFPASFSSTLKFQPGFSFCSETGLWRYGSDAVWKKSRLCFFIFLCFCVSSTTWPAHFFGPSWWWDQMPFVIYAYTCAFVKQSMHSCFSATTWPTLFSPTWSLLWWWVDASSRWAGIILNNYHHLKYHHHQAEVELNNGVMFITVDGMLKVCATMTKYYRNECW